MHFAFVSCIALEWRHRSRNLSISISMSRLYVVLGRCTHFKACDKVSNCIGIDTRNKMHPYFSSLGKYQLQYLRFGNEVFIYFYVFCQWALKIKYSPETYMRFFLLFFSTFFYLQPTMSLSQRNAIRNSNRDVYFISLSLSFVPINKMIAFSLFEASRK